MNMIKPLISKGFFCFYFLVAPHRSAQPPGLSGQRQRDSIVAFMLLSLNPESIQGRWSERQCRRLKSSALAMA
jgi:hypothetical protein